MDTTKIAILQLPFHDLQELHRALLGRFLMEEAVRQERGLEQPEYPPLLKRLEYHLGLSEEAAHELYHRVEDELWEYAWYTYTDEWALHRARRDVEKDLGKQKAALRPEELEAMVDRRYQEKFEQYVQEIDMHEETTRKAVRKNKTIK